MRTVVIVGAGMAGLAAAQALEAAGHRVVLLDKGRRHGGRLATRSVGERAFDMGAPSFAAVESTFATLVKDWTDRGFVRAVSHSDGGTDGPTVAHRGVPTMRTLPTRLAASYEVHLGTQVVELAREGSGWLVTARTGAHEPTTTAQMAADALLLTAPAPQNLALVAGLGLADATIEALTAIAYESRLTALVTASEKIPVTSDAIPIATFSPDDPIVAWVLDNQALAVSALPALTVQATRAFSEEHFDTPRDTAGATLCARAAELLGRDLELLHVHGWRFANAIRLAPVGALVDESTGAPIAFAGDGFSEREAPDAPDTRRGVERAVRSGQAAAAQLLVRS